MVVLRGEIWWASLPEPTGSGPGYRRPVLVVQADAFNQSKINTVIVVVLTSRVQLREAPGNTFLSKRVTGLPKDSVANVSQLITVDKTLLTELVARLPSQKLSQVDRGLRLVLAL